MNVKQLFVIALVGLVVACSNDRSQNGLDAETEAYLQLKRIPLDNEQRVKSALDVLDKRKSVSEAIKETDLIDHVRIEAEVEEFRRQLLISRYFDAYTKNNVTDESIRNYYNTHLSDYSSKKIHVAHILFRTNGRMSADEKNARLLKAKEAYARTQQNEPFEALVREYSDDKLSAQKGGDLGWLKAGAIDPEFSRKIFSLQEGEISEPFVTSFGYHIVKVLEGQQETTRPFEAVKGDIAYQLKQQAKDAEMSRLFKLAKK